MTTIKLRKLLHNELDVVDDSRAGGVYINFFANEKDRDERWVPVVSLHMENDSLTVASSGCLPTRNWSAHADAYARAVEFLRLTGLGEDWRATRGTGGDE